MAASPAYTATAKVGHCRVTTGVAATDGSGTGGTFSWYGGSAPAGDYMWVKAIISSTNNAGTADLADCLFHFFVDDGTTARLVRTIDAANVSAGSTTTSAGQWEVSFGPEWIFPSNVLPEFTVSVTPTAGNVDVILLCQAV
jgi:hypothetical protein